MKKVLIVAQFTQLPGEKGNNRGRFKVIAEMLSKYGYKVTVVTSKFRELDRTFRTNDSIYNNDLYDIVLLQEAGYKKNISFRRIYSMWTFTRSLKLFFESTNESFDLVYACVPGLDSAKAAGEYAKKSNIPFVIDVQDVWPEVMYDLVLDIPIISKIIFSPMQRMADQVYSLADGVMAVSKTYLDIAMKKNTTSKVNNYVFIGTNLDEYDQADTIPDLDIQKPEGEFWIAYIGSLGHSYDIYTFLEAAKVVSNMGISVRPLIIGSGPLENEFKAFATSINSNAIFTGWIDHSTMRSYLKESDAVINAIKRKAPQSITNKIGDYLSSGKPILNGSQNVEFRELIETHKFGINYQPESADSLALAIESIYNMSTSDRITMGINARRLAESQFDRKKTYTSILEMVNYLISSK